MDSMLQICSYVTLVGGALLALTIGIAAIIWAFWKVSEFWGLVSSMFEWNEAYRNLPTVERDLKKARKLAESYRDLHVRNGGLPTETALPWEEQAEQ